jgi:ferric-dicitrate binding protein FerR (iron transport regulator)
MNRDSPENVTTTLRDAQDWDQLVSLGGSAERAAFASWLRESPSNLAAYLMDTMLSVELSSLDSERQFDLDALVDTVNQQASADGSKR